MDPREAVQEGCMYCKEQASEGEVVQHGTDGKLVNLEVDSSEKSAGVVMKMSDSKPVESGVGPCLSAKG